jgi:predicted transposase/invertase (TIGR01784 family)
MNFNPEEREFYEDHLKWLRIETNTLKKTREEGREEGRKEGIVIGETRGIEKGIEKVAISMLKQKIDDSLIQSVNGFSQNELNKLKDKQ